MKTIANEAGVTLTTVSRILNGKGEHYAQATIEKIEGIAARYRYRPNALVRSIQTGKTDTAGVLIPLEGFFAEIARGIHDSLLQHRMLMMLSWDNHSQAGSGDALERSIILRMIDRRVDGFILSPSFDGYERNYVEEILKRDIPLVLVDREIQQVETDFVGTNDVESGIKAGEYLLSLGHRRFGFLGSATSKASERREAGFRLAVEALPEGSCCERLDPTVAGERQRLLAMLHGSEAPTAMFCYNDDLGMKALNLFLEQGINVPQDLSLLGFGNLAYPENAIPLSTFDQNPEHIGHTAVELYVKRIRSGTDGPLDKRLLPATLIPRASTASVG